VSNYDYSEKNMNDIHARGDLNLFRVMLAIVEEGGVTGAANRLHLSQSAISHSLKRLRELLNDPVFVKHGRNLVLTPHGRSILPIVEQSLGNLSVCAIKSGSFDPVQSEMKFNLGLRDIIEFLVLPDLLKPLREAGSKIQFNTKRIALDQMEEQLLSGITDIIVDLEFPTNQKVESEEIMREHLCVLVGSNHASYHSGTISVEQFTAGEHVSAVLDKRDRAYIENRMGDLGSLRNVVVQCEHYEAAANAVSKTDLILTLPYSYAFYVQKSLDVRLLALPFEYEPFPIRMYWRTENSKEPYIRWLISSVRGAVLTSIPEYNL